MAKSFEFEAIDKGKIKAYQNLNSAGTAYVDLFSGILGVIHPDVVYSGGKLPLNISHIYKSDLAQAELNLGGMIIYSRTEFGRGWKINLDQQIKINADKSKIVYVDGEGDMHLFIKTSVTNTTYPGTKYIEAKGSALALYPSGTDYIIVDQNDNRMRFSSSKKFCLTSITSFDGKDLTIEYDSLNRISKVTDDSLRYATFTYQDSYASETGLLQSITDCAGRIMKYGYGTNTLSTIYYVGENGSTDDYSRFHYDADDGTLTIAYDQTGAYNTFKYTNSIYNFGGDFNSLKKVSEIMELSYEGTISKNGVSRIKSIIKETLNFTYNSFNKSKNDTHKNSSASLKNRMGLKYWYHFDKNGNCINQYQAKNGGSLEMYNTIDSFCISAADEFKTHNITIAKNQAGYENLIKLPFKEREIGTPSGIVKEYYKDIPFGDFVKDIDYVISGFAVIPARINLNAGTTAKCRVALYYMLGGVQKGKVIYMNYNLNDFDKQFKALPFKVDKTKSADFIRVALESYDIGGTAAFSDISLEKAEVVSVELKPAIRATGTENPQKIYGFKDCTKITAKYKGNDYYFDLTNGEYITARDIAVMQTNTNIISILDTYQIMSFESTPELTFNDGKKYSVNKVEVIYDNEINAFYRNVSVLTKKNMDGDTEKMTVKDKYNTEFSTSYTYTNRKPLTSKDFRNLMIEKVYSGYDTKTIIKNASGGSAEKIISVTAETPSGAYTAKESDTRSSDGNIIATGYLYDENRDELKKVTFADGNSIGYGYYAHSGALKKISGTFDGIEHTIEFSYTKGYLTTVAVNGSDIYDFEYNRAGDLTKVSINGVFLYNVEYDVVKTGDIIAAALPGTIQSNMLINYSNGQKLKVYYDEYGRVNTMEGKSVLFTSQLYLNIFDSVSGLISKHYSFLNGINDDSSGDVIWDYAYDEQRKPQAAIFSGDGHSGKIAYEYTDDIPAASETVIDNLTRRAEIECEKKNGVSFYPDNRVTGINYKNSRAEGTKASVGYSYDNLSRMKKKTVKNAAGAEICAEEYKFMDVPAGAADRTTVYVEKIQYSNPGFGGGISYTYDLNGNITAEYEDNALNIKYTYDGLGRLTREDNKKLNKTSVYSYDPLGNIQKKTEAPFTLNEMITEDTHIAGTYCSGYTICGQCFVSSDRIIPAEGTKKEYKYTTTGIRNQLISYNGTDLTAFNPAPYDLSGNPLAYFYHKDKNCYWDISWMLGAKPKKLELKNSLTGLSEATVEFKYNSFGQRYKKTADGRLSTYFYNGSALMRENRGGDIINYLYDNGGISGIEFIANGISNPGAAPKLYFFRKSLQGDIISLIDASGVCVVKYVYDAWGKCTVLSDTSGINIGEINPIRYRGYYYDIETELYWLSSRYYDPEVGRFINADDVAMSICLGAGIINGINLYSYCFNDSVNYIDYGGYFPSRNKGSHGKTGKLLNDWFLKDSNGKFLDYNELNDLKKIYANDPAKIKKINTQQKALNGRRHGERTMARPDYRMPNILWTPLGQSLGINLLWTPYNQNSSPNVLWTPINQSAGPNILINPTPSGNMGWLETMPWGEIGKTAGVVVAVIAIIGLIWVIGNDITGVGAADDGLIPWLIDLIGVAFA